MKKITILALHLGYGGIEKYISSLCKMLINNYEIEIISTYKLPETEVFDIPKSIKIKYLIEYGPNKKELKESKKNIIKFFKEAVKSLYILSKKYFLNIKAIKNINSDYIITTRTFHNKLVSKYANKNIIKIATEHNYHNNNSKYINKIKKSLRNFDCFVVVTKELEEYYKKLLPNKKVVFIPNTIENIPSISSKIENNNIISVGRLSPEKGYLDLIEIVEIVKNEIGNIKLTIIGNGNELDKLKSKIIEKKLEKNVFLVGYKSTKDIQKLMLNSSIYVMTSFTESFGIVLLEAFSCGLPCVAFENSGANFLINENNGFIVKDRNKLKYAKILIKLLNNKEKIKKLQHTAKQTAYLYDIERIKINWLNLLNDYENN